MDLHIDDAGPLVLLEPRLCNQLGFFTGQVLGRLITISNRMLGKEDPLITVLTLLNGVKKLIKSRPDCQDLTCSRVRIATLKLDTQCSLSIPGRFTDDVGQIVVTGALVLQLGNQVRLEGPGAEFWVCGPVRFTSFVIQLLRAFLQCRLLDCAIDRPKCLNHFLSNRATMDVRASPCGEIDHPGLRHHHGPCLSPGSGEVTIKSMPPLVAKRPGAIHLGQVDHHLTRFIVSRCRVNAP